jgi:hypothetical protein
MPLDVFIDNLRQASRLLPQPRVSHDQGQQAELDYASLIHSADLWLTEKAVAGFDAADFAHWPKRERDSLAREVEAFRAIARQVPADKPASQSQSERARRHLEAAIGIVRQPLLLDWLEAQKRMLEEVTSAAQTNGW